MNIFYLNHNPKLAAQHHIDRHVVKMILETAQLLSTSHRVLDGYIVDVRKIDKNGKPKTVKSLVLSDQTLDKLLYKATHINHPCSIWTRTSINNYMWLYDLFVALSDEYTFRYGKCHKSFMDLSSALKRAPINISAGSLTPPAQAMPEKYKDADPVLAYRKYYAGEKIEIARWTARNKPSWFSQMETSHANV